MTEKNGTLRLVAPDPKPSQTGPRLAALRKHAGLTQQDLRVRIAAIATKLGDPYGPIDQGTYSKFETGALPLVKYEHRRLLGLAYGLSTDDLAAYLDFGTPSLETLWGHRGATPTGSSIRYDQHPAWPVAMAAARDLDPTLTDADFEELGTRLAYVDDYLDGAVVADLAAVARKHRARRLRGQGKP